VVAACEACFAIVCFVFCCFLPGLFDLPRQHPLDSDRLDYVSNPFLLEKAIEGRTAVTFLLRFFITFIAVPF
jgi:hypothetical protein